VKHLASENIGENPQFQEILIFSITIFPSNTWGYPMISPIFRTHEMISPKQSLAAPCLIGALLDA
jgi:hypothetical protein